MLNSKNESSLFSRFRTIFCVSVSVLLLAACAGDNSEMPLPDDPEYEQIAAPSPETEKPVEAAPEQPVSYPVTEKETILKNYDFVDPEHVVPYKSLEYALLYFDKNKSKFKNTDYISVINFSQSSKEKRFYIISMKSGKVWAIRVAHGKGSDSDHDGYAEKFSNTSGSNASSLGIYRTAETYTGKNGLSLRLDGLSSTNSRARSRAIVIHGASYVKEKSVIQGRSWGCPAVALENRDAVLKYLKNGSLLYIAVDNGGTERPDVPTQPVTPTNPDNSEKYSMSSLVWETSNQPQRKQWSQYLMKIILEDWSSLLKGTKDITSFCPTYNTLSTHDRANVWAQIFAAMTRYESNYNPLSRMREPGMGTDSVTRKPVYSEGLLQLSYQDTLGYKFCKFDWSKDKSLSATSSKKTILDPYINLHCGVGIMARQIARKGTIKVGSGAYWSVLKTSYSKNKISSITSMVKSLPMCK